MNLEIVALGGILAFVYLVSKSLNRPDREFRRYYREVLTSSKYKVKGQFED